MPNGRGEPFEPCVIEISPFADDLRVEMWASVFESPDSDTPTTIVRSDQTWFVEVCWDLTGKLARHLCGKWCLCLLLESVGPGEDYGGDEFCIEIDMDPCREDPYCHTFEISPDQIECRRCGSLYLVGITLVAIDPCGNPGHIAGYCRGPSVMCYPGEPHEDEEEVVEGAV